MAPPKLTQSSPAAHLLDEKFKKKKLTGEKTPLQVYRSDKLFNKNYTLERFRTFYYNYRIKKGIIRPNKQGTKSKNRNSLARTSEDSTDSSSSTYSKNDGNGEEGKLDQDIVVTQQQENGSRDKWCPINVVFSFKEYDGDVLIDIVCVVILVPSGTESFSFRVVDDGHVLCFTVYWPSVMKNSKDLHRQFLSQVGSSSIPEYHPRVFAYQEAANRLLNCSDDRLCSSTNICLPSPVLPQIRRSRFMGYRECGSRLYYIDLTAASNYQQVVTKPQLNVEATNESTSRSV